VAVGDRGMAAAGRRRRHHSGMGAANTYSLGELNKLNIYNLKGKLLSFYGHNLESNPYVQLSIESDYFDLNSLILKYRNSSSPLYLSINIRSLQCNFDKLANLVHELCKHNVPIEIIAIQETWQILHTETVTLPGFNFIFKQREKSRGGGVGFYISESLNYKIIDDLSPFVEKTLECLTIEIFTKKSKKTLLSNIYHSPTPTAGLTIKSHTENFLQSFDELLSNISLLNINTVAFTDSNINLLNLERNTVAVDYLHLIHSNSFIQSV